MRFVRKFAIFCHRWMGVAFCLLFTWWFVTGVFMMYCDFPEVHEADRLRHAQPLDASRVRIAPEQAYKATGLGGDVPPDEARLAMFDGRPAYWFGAIPNQTIVYADDGTLQDAYPSALNLRTAAAWAGHPAGAARVEQIDEPDQWTVGDVRDELPLEKYSWPDGQQVYVSPASGQVVQYTTRASRLGAYLGPIPHWLYFTPLRKNGPLWSRIVVWLSGIGTVMAISGLAVGVLVYSPSQRYRLEGRPVGIPYSGTKRLHMIFGLFFGIVACTWAFSGMLSMDPFPALLPRQAPEESRIAGALRGEIDLAKFAGKLPSDALAVASREGNSSGQINELDLISFAGEPVYIALSAQIGGAAPGSWIVPVHGASSAAFDQNRIVAAIRDAMAPVPLAEARTVSQYESYYTDRTGERPLPVVFVRPAWAELHDGFYIDPRTANIVGRENPGGWSNRWLYHGLHSLDFPWLYNHRPAWDIVVLLLLTGGITLSVTSAMIAWKLLRRKIAA